MWAVAQKHPDVVKVLLAHGADVHARSDVWSEVMAVPPHGHLEYNRAIPHGGDTALMFAARVGDLASARLLVAAGANVNDADAWGVSATALAAHAGLSANWSSSCSSKGADPNAAAAGFTALHAAIMRRDEKHGRRAPRARRGSERAASDLDADPPLVARLQFQPRAGRRDAVLAGRALQRSRASCGCWSKHGADPLFVHHGDQWWRRGAMRLRAPYRGDDRADGGDGNGRRRRRGFSLAAASAKR